MAHLSKRNIFAHLISNKIKSRLDEMVATIKEWRKGKGKKEKLDQLKIFKQIREKRKEQTRSR